MVRSRRSKWWRSSGGRVQGWGSRGNRSPGGGGGVVVVGV